MNIIRELSETVYKLGHHGINFGYGKVEYDVAKVAQESYEKVQDMIAGGEKDGG